MCQFAFKPTFVAGGTFLLCACHSHSDFTFSYNDIQTYTAFELHIAYKEKDLRIESLTTALAEIYVGTKSVAGTENRWVQAERRRDK